ncbi:D-amino acid dehydrogenase [Cupriavidus basilensis]
MKVVVLGAGLAGVPTAYFLSKAGHEVVVVDRQPGAALETSFANGSLLCLGHAYPWASPAAPGVLVKSLTRRDQALRLSPRFDPRMWGWLLKFLRECTSSRADRNAASRLRLATYSQEVMKTVVADTGIKFFHTDKGLLYLYRTEHAMTEGVRQMRVLERNGLEIKVINAKEAAAIEPALVPVRDKLLGGVYVPADGTGDARLFTEELARVSAERGVKFMYNTTIERIVCENGRASAVETSAGKIQADAVVVAMGSYSAPLLRRHGVHIDLFPVKGYSLTVPITKAEVAPTIGGLDEDNLLAFSVLGNRLRLTATAEFTGFDLRHKPSDFRYMSQAAQDLFPTIGDYSKAEMWCGLRPATPDGNAVLGKTTTPNLYVCTGGGSMGWTMSCGMGKIVSDVVCQQEVDIDIAEMLVPA